MWNQYDYPISAAQAITDATVDTSFGHRTSAIAHEQVW